MIPLVRRNLAWAARLPKKVMHSQTASGRRRGWSYQQWSDTLKTSLTFADMPIYQEWSLDNIGDDWKETKELTSDLAMFCSGPSQVAANSHLENC